MRATSSSSAISRVSRSESAWTVVSISFFCSSLSRSHLFSSVATKPFTPVSGERSSWATVATRSERSRSSRARPRPERITRATLSTGPNRRSPVDPSGDEHLVAVGGEPRLLGQPDAAAEPVVGLVAGVPLAALLVLQRHHRLQRAADRGSRSEQPPCHRVDDGDGAGRRRRPPRRPATSPAALRRQDPRRQRRSPRRNGALFLAVGGGWQVHVGEQVDGTRTGEVPARPVVPLGRRVTQGAGRLLRRKGAERGRGVQAQAAQVGVVDLAGGLVPVDVVPGDPRVRVGDREAEQRAGTR